jgi:hypothetical protein
MTLYHLEAETRWPLRRDPTDGNDVESCIDASVSAPSPSRESTDNELTERLSLLALLFARNASGGPDNFRRIYVTFHEDI